MHKKVWNNCLKIIKDNVPSISYKTWFEPIVPLKLEKKILTIQVPSPFFYEYLEEQYIDLLKKTIRKELGSDAKLEYNVVVENNYYTDQRPYTVKFPTKNNKHYQNRPVSLPPLQDNGEENAIKNPFVIPGIKKLNIDPRLNPQNTFNNFIEGECNRLARAAGLAIGDNPGGTAFNPLFIYGGSGLGKTHLAQAIGIKAKEKFPDKIVLYVDANHFQTQFVDSVRNNTKNDFLHFYQMIDVLIIDDIHEFAGKEKTQDIFFHIFNQLQHSKKQLVLTSDTPPVELEGVEQRLISRFKWGLAAELLPPDFETRINILKKKIYNDGIDMSDEVVKYMASHITENIRELEGSLISLLAQSTLNKKEITIELAKEIIDKVIKNTKKDITIEFIQKVVCNYFNVGLDLIKSKTRKREIVQARQISMYFSKNLTKASLTTIGSKIGGKDHATVLHAFKTVNNLMETDKKFRLQVEDLEKKIKS
jgi:chromosomal replication initiator protein